jgi:hypothetical protein
MPPTGPPPFGETVIRARSAAGERKLTPLSLYKTLLRATHGTCMITMILLGASIFDTSLR